MLKLFLEQHILLGEGGLLLHVLSRSGRDSMRMMLVAMLLAVMVVVLLLPLSLISYLVMVFILLSKDSTLLLHLSLKFDKALLDHRSLLVDAFDAPGIHLSARIILSKLRRVPGVLLIEPLSDISAVLDVVQAGLVGSGILRLKDTVFLLFEAFPIRLIIL